MPDATPQNAPRWFGLLALLLTLTACSETDTVRRNEEGGCTYRSVDRWFGVSVMTTEWIDDCEDR